MENEVDYLHASNVLLRPEFDKVDGAQIKIVAQHFGNVGRVIQTQLTPSLTALIRERAVQLIQNLVESAKVSKIPEMKVKKL